MFCPENGGRSGAGSELSGESESESEQSPGCSPVKQRLGQVGPHHTVLYYIRFCVRSPASSRASSSASRWARRAAPTPPSPVRISTLRKLTLSVWTISTVTS